ncbi:hypothetical protein Taro_015781, partial [Colocasia esculenta]|nr:hypothetical protein [Colocasia esculenta]
DALPGCPHLSPLSASGLLPTIWHSSGGGVELLSASSPRPAQASPSFLAQQRASGGAPLRVRRLVPPSWQRHYGRAPPRHLLPSRGTAAASSSFLLSYSSLPPIVLAAAHLPRTPEGSNIVFLRAQATYLY